LGADSQLDLRSVWLSRRLEGRSIDNTLFIYLYRRRVIFWLSRLFSEINLHIVDFTSPILPYIDLQPHLTPLAVALALANSFDLDVRVLVPISFGKVAVFLPLSFTSGSIWVVWTDAIPRPHHGGKLTVISTN
jgi:hypothetical protein